MKYFVSAVGLAVSTLLLDLFLTAIKYDWIWHSNKFVGSNACFFCHKTKHIGWSDSLHPKMMRRVSDESVVADLKSAIRGLKKTETVRDSALQQAILSF